ncbi:hypothetical protein ACFOD4_05835 [Pseudoroseomonas globiformis]|uniref:Uncharacterized protein n=1 Tax=Teichococcus globiformis TaxID=2307229 RepID=A0ABV7FW55_9PROT
MTNHSTGQPGGKTPPSENAKPENEQTRDEGKLQEELEDTFPASDPPSSSAPETSIGWDDQKSKAPVGKP